MSVGGGGKFGIPQVDASSPDLAGEPCRPELAEVR